MKKVWNALQIWKKKLRKTGLHSKWKLWRFLYLLNCYIHLLTKYCSKNTIYKLYKCLNHFIFMFLQWIKNSGIAAKTSIWSSQRFIPTRIKGLFYLLQTNSFSCSTKCTFYFTSFVSAAVIYILYIIKYLYENGSCKLKVTIQLFYYYFILSYFASLIENTVLFQYV